MVALLLLTLLAQAAPRDARPPVATASLSGRITELGSGHPLARIVVSLEAPPATRIETLTDAEGRYAFTEVSAGAYVLAAAPERHRSTYLAQRLGEKEPALYVSGAARPNLELKPGESRSDADLALTRALGIEGRVLDPVDQPIANVNVSVTRADGRFVPVRPAPTNDLGIYRLYGLPPGRYRVCAVIENDLATTTADGTRLVRTCHVAATAESEASDVVLATKDATAIDIRVQRIGSLAISGTVINARGIAVDKAVVRAVPDHEDGETISTTSEAGQFVLKGAAAGRYLLTASVGGGMPGDSERASPERGAGYAVVDVQGGDAAGVTIALAKPVTLPGSVTFEASAAPSPRQLKLVIHSRPAADRWWRAEFSSPRGAVGDDLRFELKDVSTLPRLLSVSQLPPGWAVKAIRLDKRDITFEPADLTGGARLEIVLTNQVAKPSVRIVIPPGMSSEFHVLVLPADPARWQGGLKLIPGGQAHDGVINLGAQVAGDYLVAAVPFEDAFAVSQDSSRIPQLAAAATRLTLSAGDARTFDVPLVSLPPKR